MRVQRLILIRHGESVGNEAASAAEAAGDEVIDLPFRDVDAPLSPLGERQAKAVAAVLREVGDAEVWSSPYVRAHRTGLLAGARPSVDERLRDRELGVLDHLTSHGVRERFPSEDERRAHLGKFYYRPPGGESWADVALRLRSFLSDALDAPHETVVVFAHEALVHLTRYVVEGWDERRALAAAIAEPVANASVTVLERSDGAWHAERVGDVAHLVEAGIAPTLHAGRRDAAAEGGDIDPGEPDDAEEESRVTAE
ncbi:histidine phosphatase family protein [Microbacterium sp. NPDC055683]